MTAARLLGVDEQGRRVGGKKRLEKSAANRVASRGNRRVRRGVVREDAPEPGRGIVDGRAEAVRRHRPVGVEVLDRPPRERVLAVRARKDDALRQGLSLEVREMEEYLLKRRQPPSLQRRHERHVRRLPRLQNPLRKNLNTRHHSPNYLKGIFLRESRQRDRERSCNAGRIRHLA